jgi:beta-lactamase class A
MPIYYKRSRVQRKSPVRSFMFLVLVFLLLYSFTKIHNWRNPKQILSPLQMTAAQVLGVSSTSYTELNRIVENDLQGTNGIYGISVMRFKDGKAYELDSHKTFNSASLYKLWVMGEVYEQINDGKMTLTDQLTRDISALNDSFNLASDEAELTDGVLDVPVQSALEKMITLSDNYSALILTDKIKISGLQAFLRKYGLTESNVGTNLPQTTPHDVMLFYEKLYRGEIVNKFYSDEMLSLLKRQQMNDRIPKYLPLNIPVAHKTGELDRVKHDAGIVFAPTGDYIFVVMTDSNDPISASERTAVLSKDFYNYFSTF